MLHEELLTGLKQIKQDGPSRKYSGICSNVKHTYYAEALLDGLFPCWSKYSGNTDWPVPSDNPEYDAHEAYAQL